MKDNKLKQRLIGAAVLIILVVIFVPMLLDEPREANLKATNIPPQPETGFNSKVTPLDDPMPLNEVVSVPRTPGEGSAVIVDAAPVDATAPAPTPSASGAASSTPAAPAASAELAVPDQPHEAEDAAAEVAKDMSNAAIDRLAVSAWVVQLASFSNEQNALKLRDQLRAKGYTTFVEAVDAKGTKVFRVRVGPELDRLRAEAIREKLEKELKIKGIVSRYVS